MSYQQIFDIHLNLNQNELRYAVIGWLSGAPSNPIEGQIYYDTVQQTPYFYNGATWVEFGSAGGGSVAFSGITSGTNTTAAMVVGNGATLGYTGTGTISANLFKGNTLVALADGGLGVSLADPNSDLLLFWDDSDSTISWLGLGTSLSISASTLNTIQGIRTADSPTFAGLTLTGLSGVLKAAGGVISGSATTTDLTEGSNLYFTEERVDDRVSSLLVAGSAISLVYDDSGNTLTIHTVASGIDHGILTGLTDDDHPQYSLVAGTRPFTGTVGGITPAASSDLATKWYVDTLVQGGTGAIIGLPFVTIGNDSTLTGERALTGTASAISITDNGANGSVVLNLTNTGVASGSYTYSSITVDNQGRLTSASSATTVPAPANAQFVTLGNSASLSAERVLTGTSDQIIITDNGANSTVVLSTPQNINTSSQPSFAGTILSSSVFFTTDSIGLSLSASGGYVTLTIPPSAAPYTLYLPSTVPASGRTPITDGAGQLYWTIPATGTGDALTSQPLSQFAATTSAQLAGVISDETGSGRLVFNNAPNLGTMTASSINKVNVTTPATSSTLTIVDGKTLIASSILTLTGTDSVTLTVNGNTTLTNGTHSGTNTGDQTITLQGDVTGTGTGTFTTTIANTAVTSGKIADDAIITSKIMNGAVTGVKLETIVTSGTVGSSTAIPVITYDVYGRLTSVTTATPGTGLFNNIVYISATGAGTYIPPAGLAGFIVEIVGAGGGSGGSAQGIGTCGVGGSGGGGGYSSKRYISPLASGYAYNVGTKGTSGAAGNNAGTAGNQTTFDVMTASGGLPGAGMAAGSGVSFAAGGNGGTATGGDLNIFGEPGGHGTRLSGTIGASQKGGSSFFGPGPNGFTTTSAGASGVNPGSGASGSFSVASDKAGANGADGFIKITELK